MSPDHILIIGFGGPERPEDVRPFLEEVTRGARVPAARLDEVAHHYAVIGGASPYNASTFRLVEALNARLRVAQATLPVFVGMRNWRPFLRDALREIHARGLRQGLGFILAPHRSDASFEKYVRSVEEARRLCAEEIRYDYVGPWHDHPGFSGAQAERVRDVLDTLPAGVRADAHLLFSAHSIPLEMAARSRYAEEFETSSRLVAQRLGHAAWSLAYQSRSGDPRQPWLEPDVGAALQRLRASGVLRVIVVPIGFLFDHTEVLYDLDIEASDQARRLGLEFRRASTVTDHPAFVETLAQMIRQHLSGTSRTSSAIA